ncbi:MAG: hypothetical protein NTX33_07055 [Propionibacteriales bacterium]|nr:hypothetical protein [Propionibacteriales bacterium]
MSDMPTEVHQRLRELMDRLGSSVVTDSGEFRAAFLVGSEHRRTTGPIR